MNRIPIRRKNSETSISLSDYEIVKHLIKVIKVNEGDIIKLVLINEGLVNGTVKAVNKDSIDIFFLNENIEPPLPTSNTLIIGASRPLTCKKVLEHGTTLGINKFIFFQAELSEKSYFDSKIFKPSEYQKHLTLGLSQSGVYAHLPKVEKFSSFDQIPLEEFATSNKILLSLETELTLTEISFSKKLKSCLLIGPERGFTSDEELVFEHFDFQKTSIGPSIQRVEYAVASALGQIELLKSS